MRLARKRVRVKLRWANNYLGAQQPEHRDLPATTLTKTA